MDRVDVKIFRSLFQGELAGPLSMDPRTSFKAIARSLDIDELTVRNRLRRLQRMGFLKGWRLFVNPTLLGVELVQALIEFRSPRRQLIEALRALPRITAIVEHLADSMWIAFICDDDQSCGRQVNLIEELAGTKVSALFKARFPNSDLKLTPTDVEMVANLSRDPRKRYSDVAKELGLSTRTVRRRLVRLVEGKAVFVIPSMDPSSLEGALFADFLVEYAGAEDMIRVNQDIHTKLESYLVRSQLGDPDYGFFNLLITKVSAIREILDSVTSIRGVKGGRIDVVQDRLEMFDHFEGIQRLRLTAKSRFRHAKLDS